MSSGQHLSNACPWHVPPPKSALPRAFFGCIFQRQGTASSRTQALLDAHADKLLADPEAIVQRLVDAVDRLFTEHYRELIPLWDMTKGLAATRKVILDEWTSLVDILAATSKGKGTTKEASNFTLERFERWGGTLQWWLGHYEVQEAVEREPQDLTLHRLAGIIGQVDEVWAYVLLLLHCVSLVV